MASYSITTKERNTINDLDTRLDQILTDGVVSIDTSFMPPLLGYPADVDLKRTVRQALEYGILALFKALVQLPDSFTAPTFQNSWVNFDGGYQVAGFYKDPFGVVHLRGLVKNGTVGQPIFTLPEGYRPAARLLFAAASNDAFGRVDILANGHVNAEIGNNAYVSLNGISFRP